MDYKNDKVKLFLGDCLVRLKELEDNSIDSVVTDAPYGINFMNKKWDYQVPSVEVWKECLRVLKPGGYLLSFAGTRTQHRLACNIEDAGFEIRDMIAWVYAQGMPKHKSCLKPALEPITMARKPAKKATLLNIDDCRVEGRERTDYGLTNSKRSQGNCYGSPTQSADFDSSKGRYPSNLIHDGSDEVLELFPDSNGAGKSLPRVKITGYGEGIGTGKSEYLGGERIPFNSGSGSAARFYKSFNMEDNEWLDLNLPQLSAKIAEKNLPLQEAVDAFVLSGAVTSALQEGKVLKSTTTPTMNVTAKELRRLAESVIKTMLRIKKEFLLEQPQEEHFLTFNLVSVAVMKKQTGITTITVSHWKSDGYAEPVTFSIMQSNMALGEEASIKYCAKANKKDREEGNTHPTIKPTELMKYLVKLVTPKDGIVLDPFLGSGSTGKAAVSLGYSFIGVERELEYFTIAQDRISKAINQHNSIHYLENTRLAFAERINSIRNQDNSNEPVILVG